MAEGDHPRLCKVCVGLGEKWATTGRGTPESEAWSMRGIAGIVHPLWNLDFPYFPATFKRRNKMF